MRAANSSIAAITSTAPIGRHPVVRPPFREMHRIAPRLTGVAAGEEHEDERQAAEEIHHEAQPVATAVGTIGALADQVIHEGQQHRQHPEQQVEVEVAGDPQGVVHHPVDADRAIDDGGNDPRRPAEHRQYHQHGRHAPAQAGAVDVGERAIGDHREYRQAFGMRGDLADDHRPAGHREVHQQVVRKDDQHQDRVGRPCPQERARHAPGPAGVAREQLVHPDHGHVDAAVDEHVPEEVDEVLGEQRVSTKSGA